jgi:dienelactone hydrolase
MSPDNFTSAGKSYGITVYPAPADGKKHPTVLVVHGNAGLNPPFGHQIDLFAKSLAALGYVTAIPQYYTDDLPHLIDGDPGPHVATLADAIAKVAARTDADPDRLGLVGYSLGAATSMTYIASNSPGKVKVLVDFFGPIEGNSIIAAGVARFPPTLILHNSKDGIVKFVPNSKALDGMLPGSVEHLLVEYSEDFPKYYCHPFIPDGEPDVDSRKRATDWVLRHLPPNS